MLLALPNPGNQPISTATTATTKKSNIPSLLNLTNKDTEKLKKNKKSSQIFNNKSSQVSSKKSSPKSSQKSSQKSSNIFSSINNTSIVSNDYFNKYNALNLINNKKIGVTGFPLVIYSKNKSYFLKFFINEKNSNDTVHTNSYYEYSLLKKITNINKDNNYNLPFINVFEYKRGLKSKILKLIEKSDLKNKNLIYTKLSKIFAESSSTKIGFYKMENIENNKALEDILFNISLADLKSIIFQCYNGLFKIKETYPNFVHNDLHFYNILVTENKENKKLETNLNNKLYKLNVSNYQAYIIDFNMSIIDDIENHSISSRFKTRDQNYDEFYILLNLVLTYFNYIISKINTGIIFFKLREKYFKLKSENNYLYIIYEKILYFYLFGIIEEYLYCLKEKKYKNMKNIEVPSIVFETFNFIQPLLSIPVILVFYIFSKHQSDKFSNTNKTYKIYYNEQNKLIKIYKSIYDINVPYLEINNIIVDYILKDNNKVLMKDPEILKLLFGDILQLQ